LIQRQRMSLKASREQTDEKTSFQSRMPTAKEAII
jgi:hypothetical protein